MTGMSGMSPDRVSGSCMECVREIMKDTLHSVYKMQILFQFTNESKTVFVNYDISQKNHPMIMA